MVMILNQDTETEYQTDIERFDEDLIQNQLQVSIYWPITSSEKFKIPSDLNVSNIHIYTELNGAELPIIGTYTIINRIHGIMTEGNDQFEYLFNFI